MAVCSVCGKDNQPQYKFCLGCGAELDGGTRIGGPAVRAPAPAASPRPATAPPVFNDMGPDTDRMNDGDLPTFPDAVPPPTNGASVEGAGARPCPSCGTMVAGNFRFCPSCGAGVEPAKTAEPAPAPTGHANVSGKLVIIRPDGSEGGSHPLKPGENAIGRSLGPLFEADGYLSPMHAQLVLNAAGLVVRDAGSLNGVFLKINGEEQLSDGDVFRIGQELLRFDVIPAPEPLDDGTEILGSPNPGYWGRLAVIVGRDQDGSAFPLSGEGVMLGRERGEITFPEDGYVSGSHARVSQRAGHFYLADLGSSNGTFLRIRGERAIASGSFLLMGQQLFRVTY